MNKQEKHIQASQGEDTMDKQEDENNQRPIFPLFVCIAFCMFWGFFLNMLHFEILSPVPSWLEIPVEYPILSTLCIFAVVMWCYFLIEAISERLNNI